VCNPSSTVLELECAAVCESWITLQVNVYVRKRKEKIIVPLRETLSRDFAIK